MDTTPAPRPTPTSAVTVPIATLRALSGAIDGWAAAVYPGATAHVEAASRHPAARRPHTWHATARLSNGVRLRFTLFVHDDGVAWVTRHARLAGGDAAARASVRAGSDRDDAAGRGTPAARRMGTP